MSQQHTETAPDTGRANMDEALFHREANFHLPPEVPDLPPAPPATEGFGPIDTARGFSPDALPPGGYDYQHEGTPAVALQCGTGSYHLADLAPGVYEMRETPPPAPPQEEIAAPEQADEPPVEEAPPEQPVAHAEEPPPEPEGEPAVYEVPPPRLPLALGEPGQITVCPGETASLTTEHVPITGAEPAVIDLVVHSPPAQGTLLRDGFALTAGDAFTLEDVLQSRISYRHEGDTPGEDSFSYTTPGGEIPPTSIRISVSPPPHQSPTLNSPGMISDVLAGCGVAAILADTTIGGVGIAVVAATGRGKWEYRLCDEADWQPLPEVQHGKALLLSHAATVRFTPRKSWSGTVKISYRAWDATTGADGEQVNLAARASVGGSTAYSANAVTAALAVEAPPEEQLPLPPAPWENQPSANELTGDGLAVVRLQGEGEWQYSLDGGRTWRGLGPVYHGKARVLRPSDKVRFLPRKGKGGRVSISGRLWDGRGASAGSTVCLAGKGSVGDETPYGESVQTWAWHLDTAS
jgi:hypothetical protein